MNKFLALLCVILILCISGLTAAMWLYSPPAGMPGSSGVPGLSAYDIAVDNGFDGTEEDWLASLDGKDLTNTPYSLGETDTGKVWIDGKEIYRTVIQQTFTVYTTTPSFYINQSIDCVISCLCYRKSDGWFVTFPFSTISPDGIITTTTGYNAGETATVIVEYTKN